MFSLSGRTALVTGSSSGIGKEIALMFARQGADVIVHCAKNIHGACAVSEEIKSSGRKSDYLAADLSNPEECRKLVEKAFEFAPGLDIWVNNAGVDLLTGENKELNYFEKLQKLLDMDVRSTVMLSHLAASRLPSGSSIINIGWDQADTGMEGPSGELFACAKNAIMGFTRSHAKSLAPAIRVNCIAPGWIKTSWGETASKLWQDRVMSETPMKRWGLPSDIATAAVFLAAHESSFITGQILNINGGAV